MAILKNFKLGRGAESCLVSFKLSDTSQRPVRRFLSATPVSLPWPDRMVFVWLHAARADQLTANTLHRRRRTLRFHGRTEKSGETILPPTMCAAQARPARSFGHQKQVAGPEPSASPVSPEGDHFPRTPMVKVHVVPSPPAPAPPRQDASWCIRGGTRAVWGEVRGR